MKKDLIRLAENLDKLDKLRRQTRNACIFAGILFILIIIMLVFMMNGDVFPAAIPFETAAMYICFGMMGGLPIMVAKIRRRYKKLYNAVIVRNSLEQYFEIDEFNSDYGIPQNLINSTGMIRTGNSFKADDFIKGKYKDIAFMQSDVLLEDRASFTEYIKTKPITYFKGRWMIFEFNKRFKCDLLIYEKNILPTGKKFSLFADSNFKKVEFEVSEFNSHFTCYTDNQQEAFYVLTPHLMESIEQIRQNTRGALLLCFRNNLLHVGVNSGKWAFEPPIFSKIDVAQVRTSIDSDIKLITQFVDELKLNEKVYKID